MKKSFLLLTMIVLFSTSNFSHANQSKTIEISETKDLPDMVNVVASIQIKEGKMTEFLDIFNSNIPNVLAEKGCIEYVPTIDVATDIGAQVTNKNEVTVIEKWASLKDLLAHLSAPHMVEYREKVKDIVVGVEIKVLSKVSK